MLFGAKHRPFAWLTKKFSQLLWRGMSRHHRSRRRKSYNIPGHAHELTFSCFHRFKFLQAERCCQWLAEALAAARLKHEFWLWAYVFMPDHVHLVLCPFRTEYDVAAILKSIKQPVGNKAIAFLEAERSPWLARLTRKRGGRIERLFWQSGGGYDRNITSPRTLLKMIDYTHENPVRKKLATAPQDWKWSSAAHYAGGTSPIVIDPIPPEWVEVDT
jgi:putative transposase